MSVTNAVFFLQGVEEDGDGLYEAPCVGGAGDSGGREARMLQTGDGSVMVNGTEEPEVEPEGESSLSILVQVGYLNSYAIVA